MIQGSNDTEIIWASIEDSYHIDLAVGVRLPKEYENPESLLKIGNLLQQTYPHNFSMTETRTCFHSDVRLYCTGLSLNRLQALIESTIGMMKSGPEA